MRQFGPVVLVVLVLGVVGPAFSQDEPGECQYVLVAEQCRQNVLVLDIGINEVAGRVRLDDGEAGNTALFGIDFTTVPDYGEFFAFASQGPLLRVIDIRWDSPVRDIDVEHVFHLENVILGRVHAAPPVPVAGQLPRYPLYVTASRSGVPWVLVFDQEVLLDDSSNPRTALLGSGPIHADCEDCVGPALDIAAGGSRPAEGIQEAYVSVLDEPDSDMWLRIYRLVLHENFSFDVFLDPWNDEGLPYDGSAYRANGLDYDSTGTQPFGVFQTTSVVGDLSNGESSCELSGHANDVAVWGPGSGMEHPNFNFVTSVVPSGADLLLGFPAGGCPDGGAASLSFPIADFPRALALSSVTSDALWIYTANRYESITAVHLALSSDVELGDRIDVIDSFDLATDGECPFAVAIRDESYLVCVSGIAKPPISRPPKVDCIEDPDDPRCKHIDLEPTGNNDD